MAGPANPPGTLEVAVDARALADASRFRGIGTYVRGLLTALTAGSDRSGPAVHVVALAPASAPVPDGVLHVPVSRHAPDRWATIEHRWLVSRELGRIPADVNHSPALDPLRHSSRPWVQTVADVLPLEDPDPAFAVERRRWRRWAARVRAADAVITFSNHGAEQARRHLGVESRRLHVVPLAAGAEMTPDAGRRQAVERPFLLYVGEFGPHKGLKEAAAVAALLAGRGPDCSLRVAGRLTAANRPAVEAALQAGAGSRWRAHVELLGWVEDLAALYQSAAALIVTSRHEGFGLPALEAMSCGTPVVAFDNSAVREVVGSGGTLVTDGDVAAMVAEVTSLLRDRRRWEEAAGAALQRAGSFDWATTARHHVDVYRSVACG